MTRLRSVLVMTALATVLSAPAFAADLAPQAMEPMAPAMAEPFSWTGYYVGVNAGALFTTSKFDNSADPASIATGGGFNFDSTSFIGGLHAGYNYQVGQVVIGADLSAAYTGLDDKGSSSGPVVGDVRTRQNWLASAGLRLGYAFDRVLVYGSGGVAFTSFSNDTDVTVMSLVIRRSFGDDSRVGWTLGAGLEYAVTDHWTAGLDYKYYDFGASNYDTRGGAQGGPGFEQYKIERTESAVTARASYKF